MSEVTKQDLDQVQENILQAVNKGFQGVQDQIDEIISIQKDHSVALDKLTEGVSRLEEEAGAQSMINDRFDKRLARLERHAGLEPIAA